MASVGCCSPSHRREEGRVAVLLGRQARRTGQWISGQRTCRRPSGGRCKRMMSRVWRVVLRKRVVLVRHSWRSSSSCGSRGRLSCVKWCRMGPKVELGMMGLGCQMLVVLEVLFVRHCANFCVVCRWRRHCLLCFTALDVMRSHSFTPLFQKYKSLYFRRQNMCILFHLFRTSVHHQTDHVYVFHSITVCRHLYICTCTSLSYPSLLS